MIMMFVILENGIIIAMSLIHLVVRSIENYTNRLYIFTK